LTNAPKHSREAMEDGLAQSETNGSDDSVTWSQDFATDESVLKFTQNVMRWVQEHPTEKDAVPDDAIQFLLDIYESRRKNVSQAAATVLWDLAFDSFTWDSERQLWLGQRSQSSMLSTLPDDAIHQVIRTVCPTFTFPGSSHPATPQVTSDPIKFFVALLGGNNSAIHEVLLERCRALTADQWDQVLAIGGVRVLVSLLGMQHSDKVRLDAAFVLWGMSVQATCIVAIAEAGGVRALLSLLQSPDCRLQRASAGVIRNLAANPRNRDAITEAGGLGLLKHLLASESDAVVEQAAFGICNLAATAAGRAEIAKLGAIPALAKLLSTECQSLQEAVAGTVRNLAASESYRRTLASTQAVVLLLPLLKTRSEAVRDAAAGALCNLTVCAENSKKLVQSQGVPALLSCLHGTSPWTSENAAAALFHLSLTRKDSRTPCAKQSAQNNHNNSHKTRTNPPTSVCLLSSCRWIVTLISSPFGPVVSQRSHARALNHRHCFTRATAHPHSNTHNTP